MFSFMEPTKTEAPVPFFEAILKRKIVQICDYTGYHAITPDSINILANLYRKIIFDLGRHCKNAANRNRRSEATLMDLMAAFDFIRISIQELKEHADSVKLPFPVELEYHEVKPTNRVQRNFLVDDLLEAEKNAQQDEQDDNDTKLNENDPEGKETVDKHSLKDTYEAIVREFPDCPPVSADKSIKLSGRIVLVASTKLKITTPLPPEPEPKLEPEPEPEPVEQKLKIKGKQSFKKKLKKSITPEVTTASTSRVEESIPKTKPPSKKKLKKSITPEVTTASTSRVEESTPKIKPPSKKKLKRVVTPEVTTASTLRVEEIAPDIKPPSKKKPKRVVTPLDPSIAEPPSFLPLLDTKLEEPFVEELEPLPRIETPPAKQPAKGKKRKKRDQFAIVTETVTAVDDKEWFCPICKGPDNGDLMVQCDSCEEWYHLGCTNLKKPPGDDENWNCEICAAKRNVEKRVCTPVEAAPKAIKVEPLTLEQPSPPEEQQEIPTQPPPVAQSTSHDDLCPECNLPDDGTMMIQCDDPFCARWFHGKCVGLLEEPKEDESWFCKACVEKQQSAFSRRRRVK